MTKKTEVKKPISSKKTVKKEIPVKKQYKAELTEEASKALERIMSFNPLKSKKEVASMIMLEVVKQYKGKKPPKAKK